MPLGPTTLLRIEVTPEWIRRRDELMDRLDQAAIEGCLLDARTQEERELVLACLRERERNKAARARPDRMR